MRVRGEQGGGEMKWEDKKNSIIHAKCNGV